MGSIFRTILYLLDEEQKGLRDWHWADYWTAMYCGNWKWCESVSSCWLNMIEPNDTMKMAIGKEAILQKCQSIATMHYQWTVSMTGKYLPPYTNTFLKESPVYSWWSWPFVWSSSPILVKIFCLQSAYESASCLCQSGVIFCIDNISRCLGRPGLTNIKLHWYDLFHQLHLQINTLVLLTIITDNLGRFLFSKKTVYISPVYI